MKRINPGRAKKHRSFAVTELAELLGVHKSTVRGWLKKGLPSIDGVKPTLIDGSEFQEWWGEQRKATRLQGDHAIRGRCIASNAESPRPPPRGWSTMLRQMPPRAI